jgi:hypothetical protein
MATRRARSRGEPRRTTRSGGAGSAEQLRFQRLAEYRGIKLGRWLRHEVKEEIHSLFQKLVLLRELDPRAEEDLRRFKLLEPLELYEKVLAGERRS